MSENTNLFEEQTTDKDNKALHFAVVNRSPLSLVFNEDCVAGMKRFSDGHFDLAVVDPPYGIGASSVKFKNGTSKYNNGGFKDKEKDWDSEIPDADYFKELFRVSKNQIIWGGNYFIEHLKNTRCVIVWDKGTGENSYADGEMAWTSFDNVLRIFKKVWVGANAKNEGKRIHPTEKPVELYDFIFKEFAKPGYLILDTHLGSGSSRIACEKAGLDFVGFELDTDYFLSQEKRFKDHLVQGRLFGADFC